MNRKLLTIAIALMIFAIVVAPAAATVPKISPLPGTYPWYQVWGLVVDLQNQINALKYKVDHIQLIPGPQGPKGATGATGAQGPKGLTGATGSQGPVGPSGAQGPAGATGAQGPAGATGAQGPAGATGATGATGTSNILVITGSVTSVDNTIPGAIKTVDVPDGYTGAQCAVVITSDSPQFSVASTPATITITKSAAYSETDGKFHPVNIVSVEGQGGFSAPSSYVMVCQKP